MCKFFHPFYTSIELTLDFFSIFTAFSKNNPEGEAVKEILPKLPDNVQAVESDFFESLSTEYKQLYNQVLESWFFLRNSQEDVNKQEVLYDRYRMLLSHAERLRDVLEPQKRKMAQKLSEIVFQRLDHLQNPSNCDDAKFAICDIGKGCGFGCQIHHVAYCLIIAYATERSLHLRGKPWSYTPNGFASIFYDLGSTEKCSSVMDANPPVDWTGKSFFVTSFIFHIQTLFIDLNLL